MEHRKKFFFDICIFFVIPQALARPSTAFWRPPLISAYYRDTFSGLVLSPTKDLCPPNRWGTSKKAVNLDGGIDGDGSA